MSAEPVRDDFFNQAYRGRPPWDIGRPQPEFVSLADEGEIRGAVLDVGCGTGENALHLAALGHEVWGIDLAPRAIERARAKAAERRLPASFLVGNALALGDLGRTFDTVIDCGLFHTLSDSERRRFTQSLAVALVPGGRYFMLCFSEHQPGEFGPRRVTQAEIRATFSKGWRIDYIRAARFDTTSGRATVRAWLSSIARL